MDDIAESCGCMTAEWLDEQLADFMYTFDNDSNGEFVAKANDLSKRYRKTGEDFISELIAFVTNEKQTHVDRPMLDIFEQQVLCNTVQVNKDEHFNSSHSRVAFSEVNEESWLKGSSADNTSHFVDEISFSNDNTNFSKKNLPFSTIRKSESDIIYQSRNDSGKVVAKFVGAIFDTKKIGAMRSGVRKIVIKKCGTDDFKNLLQYGAEKVSEQAEELISRVESVVNIIKEENEGVIEDEEINLTASKNLLWGFIINSNEDRLDASNCALQCTDENGSIVKLDLNNLKTYSLFPGKVVVLRGAFANDVFMPDKIFECKKLPNALLNIQTDVGLLRIWCACGPFTSPKILSYEQLFDLITLAKNERPDVLILIGPFIDRTSPVIRSSQCCVTFDELMDSLLAKIDDTLSGTDVQVLVIPNGRKDATLRPSFPTPPFPLPRQRRQQFSKNIMLLPDPSVIHIAGVECAISASEIIQHLGRDEISSLSDGENQDRISRLIGELFRQRSLYPLYPAPDEVPFRLREALIRTSLSQIPHVLILPSMLAPSIKIVDGSVFVNTNVLVRGSSGTFMKLHIDLSEINTRRENSNTSIADFCEVQIVRL